MGLSCDDDDDTTEDGSENTGEEDDQAAEEHFDDDIETWVEWIHRATHIAEDSLSRAGIDDWVVAQKRCKFKWAGHTARRTDGRWATKILDWTPSVGSRSVGRPRKRWSDTLASHFGYLDIGEDGWRHAALDRHTWHDNEEEFCKGCCS